MFCTRCGQTLPADGTPCPCGSGQRDLSAPQQPAVNPYGGAATMNGPDYGQQNTYAQPAYNQPGYGAQPNPYAPPVYAVQQPNTPFVAAIRQAAASPLFMVATIIMSVCLLFSAIQCFVPVNYVRLFHSLVPFIEMIDPASVGDYLEAINSVIPQVYAMQASMGLLTLPSLISPALLVAALWITFTSARKKAAPSTGGLTILQVLQIIALVGVGFGILTMVGLGVVMVVLLTMLMEEVGRYGIIPHETANTIAVVYVTLMIVLILVMVLELVFNIKALTTILQVKKGIKEGVVTKPASVFVMIYCYISGGFTVLAALLMSGWLSWASVVTMILGSAGNIIFGVCIGQYNKLVKPLLKPNTQQPVPQPYDPYNGGYPPVY